MDLGPPKNGIIPWLKDIIPYSCGGIVDIMNGTSTPPLSTYGIQALGHY